LQRYLTSEEHFMKTSIILENMFFGLIIVLISLITLFSIEQKKQSQVAIPSQESCLQTCAKTSNDNVADIKDTVKIYHHNH